MEKYYLFSCYTGVLYGPMSKEEAIEIQKKDGYRNPMEILKVVRTRWGDDV